MKKIILVALTLVMFVFAVGFCAIGTDCNLYSKAAIVTSFETETDTVVVTDFNGFQWAFYGIEDYEIGDVVTMIISNAGTENSIFDDVILETRYSGYTFNNLED